MQNTKEHIEIKPALLLEIFSNFQNNQICSFLIKQSIE